MAREKDLVDYFAYGSNLNTEQLKDRDISYLNVERAELPGWKLVFTEHSETWGGGVADIIPTSPKGKVEGVIYTIQPEGLRELDLYEGRRVNDGREIGFYRRQYLPVKVQDEWNTVLTYVVNLTYEHKRKKRFTPSKRYIETIVKGAEEHGLDDEYIRRLQDMG